MPTYAIDGKAVKFEDRGKARFLKPIAQVVDFQSFAVVRLEATTVQYDNRNVYGVDTSNGKVVWQVEASTDPALDYDPYVEIARASYRWDLVAAYSWSTWVLVVDVESGRVKSRRWTK